MNPQWLLRRLTLVSYLWLPSPNCAISVLRVGNSRSLFTALGFHGVNLFLLSPRRPLPVFESWFQRARLETKSYG